MNNKTTLVFETSAEMKDFMARRKLYSPEIDTREVTLTALLNNGDIEFAKKEYKARVVRRSK